MSDRRVWREEMMARRNSTLEDLREVFERGVTVRYIAEPLASFDEETPAALVRGFMERRDYDVVGVRRGGLTVGYVERSSLSGGTLAGALKPFEEADVVEDTMSLLPALRCMRQRGRLFVDVFGRVAGIVTVADLEKMPVRMWLFGLVSLIEMQLLRLIREAYPDQGWQNLPGLEGVEEAQRRFGGKRARNAAIDLAECLSFGAKCSVLVQTPKLVSRIDARDIGEVRRLLGELKDLRDDLAHAKDVVIGRWPGIVDLAQQAEEFLEKCERVTLRRSCSDSHSAYGTDVGFC